MPEDGLNLSKPVIQRAIALLDDVFEEISDRARWSDRAFAADASGKPILGRVEDAVESERAVARCAFGSLLHQGLARGYRIEIAAVPYEEQNVTEVTRAPDSWMVAAAALAHVGLDMLDEVHALRRVRSGSLSYGRDADKDKGYARVAWLALQRRKGKA